MITSIAVFLYSKFLWSILIVLDSGKRIFNIDVDDKIVCISTNKLRDKVDGSTLFYDLTIQKK